MPVVQQILVSDHGLEAVEPLAEVFGVLSALGDPPRDELLAVVHRGIEIEGIGRGHVGQRQPRSGGCAQEAAGRADKKITSPHQSSPR